MEINIEHVQETFRLYSGEAMDGQEPSRDSLCKALCRECAGWVQRQLIPQTPEGRLGDAESFAAAQAFCQLALLDQEPQSVSSPELKVELGNRAEYARLLCEQKRLACDGILAPDRFYFGQA